MYEQLKERIKEHEGFVPRIYKDSLGFATIGYGHLVKEGEQWEEGKEYTKEQLEYVFDTDFEEAKKTTMSAISSDIVNLFSSGISDSISFLAFSGSFLLDNHFSYNGVMTSAGITQFTLTP